LLLLLLLLYQRLISFEIDRGSGATRQDGAESAVSHGCLRDLLERSISKSRSDPQG
jgi:hypothetical protein